MTQHEKEIQKVINQARIINREELLKIFEENINDIKEDKYNCYGNRKYDFIQKEKEHQKYLLEKFDKGEKVPFLVSYDHFGYGTWGEDTITRLYTDGTYDVKRHLAD